MSEPNDSTEKRVLQRHVFSAPASICQRGTDLVLGRLANIHDQGMMVVGNSPFEEAEEYALDIHLPEPINSRSIIEVDVICLWARNDDDNVCWAGCGVIDITEDNAKALQTLVEVLAD